MIGKSDSTMIDWLCHHLLNMLKPIKTITQPLLGNGKILNGYFFIKY